jgi:hypothetical protein
MAAVSHRRQSWGRADPEIRRSLNDCREWRHVLQRRNRGSGTAATGGAAGAGKPANAEIKPHNGQLSLFIGGAQAAPLAVELERATPTAQLESAAEAGARLFWLNRVDLGWAGPARGDAARVAPGGPTHRR